jgi:hypothetical protein
MYTAFLLKNNIYILFVAPPTSDRTIAKNKIFTSDVASKEKMTVLAKTLVSH